MNVEFFEALAMLEKEKGIIGQEIKMYQDEPGWESLFALLRAMYHNHPVRIDIAGTVESISHIECGSRLPSMQVFIKLIEVLNVSADYLLRDYISTGKLFGDNALGSKIEKLSPKERVALEALIDTYLQYHN